MKKLIVVVMFLMASTRLQAMPDILGDQYWLDITVGGKFLGFQLKTAEGSSGWALGSHTYDDIEFFKSHVYYNQDGTRRIEDSVSEISVIRFYRSYSRWFYSDFGFGLGYVSGEQAENCSRQPQASAYICNEVDISSPSLPIEANFMFGRYAGIGVKLRLTVAKDFNAAVVGVNLPFGTFTHGDK